MAFLHQRLVAVNVTDASAIPKLDDLYLYRQPEPGDLPPAAAGAAMLALLEREEFPDWAVAFYDSLNAVGRNQPAPPRLALISEDAILLAPTLEPGGWRAFLIAEDTAINQPRSFRLAGDPEPCCWLIVGAPAPGSEGAVWAAEGAFLAILQSPDAPD